MMDIFIKRGNSDTETDERHQAHTWRTPSANQEAPERLKARREARNRLSLPTFGRGQTLLTL